MNEKCQTENLATLITKTAKVKPKCAKRQQMTGLQTYSGIRAGYSVFDVGTQ